MSQGLQEVAHRFCCGLFSGFAILVSGVLICSGIEQHFNAFCLACDGCTGFKDLESQHDYMLSSGSWGIIVSLFEKYGGRFPCV